MAASARDLARGSRDGVLSAAFAIEAQFADIANRQPVPEEAIKNIDL